MSNHDEQLSPTPGQRAINIFKRPDVKRTLVFGILWTAVFVILGLYFYPKWMPEIMSNDMKAMERIMVGFTVISAPIAGLVMGIATQAITNRHKGDTPPPDGPAIRTNGPVVMVWTVVSGIFCLIAVVWGIAELNSMAIEAKAGSKEAIHIQVIGSQWVWSFKYTDLGVESDKLMLPIDRPVEFDVISEDVNHSFWPVQLGVKVDANRLQTTVADTVPTKLGRIDVKCAELCGLYHAYMETSGEVMTQADFNNWITSNGGHAA
ncbi:MAG: cytochrome c oxidase subunit II [Actinomycetes bacterium]